MKFKILVAMAAVALATQAIAGPPYLTDDPVPTDEGHWEIYGFVSGEGRHSTMDADGGFDLNYGALDNLQLTATLPLTFSHDPIDGLRSGPGDLEFGVKYRFIKDERDGLSVAIFPRAILPTSRSDRQNRTRLLLPIWLGEDISGGTSIFGGGGYEINPGAGNRNFFEAGLAITHEVTNKVSIGGELTWQQPDSIDGTNQVRPGIGSIVKLTRRYALLFSGGPTFADHRTSYHFYTALGLLF